MHGLTEEFLADKPLFEAVAQDLMDYLADAEIESWPRTDGLGLTSRSKEILDELVERADRRSNAARPLGNR